MTKRLQLYKCGVCGNMVTVVHASGGTLSCCEQPMLLMTENTVDAAKEKHVPVIEKTGGGITVKVGAVAHPMEADHYIEWIEVVAGDHTRRQFLKPGVAPEAVFDSMAADGVTAREYCNKHGHWKS